MSMADPSFSPMTDLGEHAGHQCFWADPERFVRPGFYMRIDGQDRLVWDPSVDVAGASVVSVRQVPWAPGSNGGLAVELSNGVSAAFRLPLAA